MQELIDLFSRPAILLGFICGLLGAARSYLAAKQRDAVGVGLLNLLIGAMLAAWAADHFIHPPSGTVLMAIPLGVVAGSAGGYVLDAVVAMLPNLARQALKALAPPWLAKLFDDGGNP